MEQQGAREMLIHRRRYFPATAIHYEGTKVRRYHPFIFSTSNFAFERLFATLPPPTRPTIAMAARCISRSCSQLVPSTSSFAVRAVNHPAPRRQLHSSPPPIFDFLVPAFPSSLLYKASIARPTSRAAQRCKRTFASSPRCRQATAIFNPRQDEDGNDMRVEITPRAANVRLRSPKCTSWID